MSIETYTNGSSSILSDARSNIAYKKPRIREGFIVFPYMALELLAIYILGFAIADFYVGGMLQDHEYYPFYVTPLLIAPLIIAIMFSRMGFYELSNLQTPTRIALPLMKRTAGAFILLILIGFLAGIASEYSRIWFVSWSFGCISLILVLRTVLSRIMHRLSNLDIKMNQIAILGDPETMSQVSSKFQSENTNDEIAGLFNHDDKEELKHLINFAQATELDRIIIAKDTIKRSEMTKTLEALSILPCEVDIHPGFLGETTTVSNLNPINRVKMIRVQQTPISDWGLLGKEIFDKISALLGLIALSPLFALVAIAIKLDSNGPVIFKQIRHGYNQREINVWKFRTMTVMENGGDFKQASKNDARVTRIGNFLRKTSIDELPQLVNVLIGDMSIVGPRPHPVALNDDFSQTLLRYNNRHKVKPGITGWAQINGYRGPTNKPGQMDKRVEFDLDYIDNWSFWLDIKIIMATPYYGLVSKNAF